MTVPSLVSALAAAARGAVHPVAAVPGPRGACSCGAEDTLLADRDDGTVVRHGGIVAKAHAPDTEPRALARRVAAATRLPGILLPPSDPAPAELLGRRVTLWPYGAPVDPDTPEAAPWEAAATLLARLHRTPAPDGLPPMRGPVKAARAMARLRAAGPHPAAAPVLRAWAALPGWARAEAPMPDATTLCHGDLHLGQLVRHPAPDGPWLLIDVDDLGVGPRPGTWPAPPPGTPAGCCRPTSGSASWPPTGTPAAPPCPPTAIPGPPWTSRPAPSPCRPRPSRSPNPPPRKSRWTRCSRPWSTPVTE